MHNTNISRCKSDINGSGQRRDQDSVNSNSRCGCQPEHLKHVKCDRINL